MKKFEFKLDRVMDWRRTQARLEEAKLEHLFAGLREIDRKEAALLEQERESSQAVVDSDSVSGFDLGVLDAFKQTLVPQRIRFEMARVECRKQIAVQTQILAVKRRDVRLLEKLKAQRLTKWTAEMLREIDQQAEESYLSKFARL